LRGTAIPAHGTCLSAYNEFFNRSIIFQDNTINFHRRRLADAYLRLINE
jgi:hypothetical protein